MNDKIDNISMGENRSNAYEIASIENLLSILGNAKESIAALAIIIEDIIKKQNEHRNELNEIKALLER